MFRIEVFIVFFFDTVVLYCKTTELSTLFFAQCITTSTLTAIFPDEIKDTFQSNIS